MNLTKIKTLLSSMVIVLALAHCAGSTGSLRSSSSTPAASGKVKTKVGQNGNTKIELQVEHLAPPKAVDSEATTYVVWVEDHDSGRVTNLGALQVNDDLKGKVSTATPFTKFDLFITPERDVTSAYPSGQHVLWASLNVD